MYIIPKQFKYNVELTYRPQYFSLFKIIYDGIDNNIHTNYGGYNWFLSIQIMYWNLWIEPNEYTNKL